MTTAKNGKATNSMLQIKQQPFCPFIHCLAKLNVCRCCKTGYNASQENQTLRLVFSIYKYADKLFKLVKYRKIMF